VSTGTGTAGKKARRWFLLELNQTFPHSFSWKDKSEARVNELSNFQKILPKESSYQ